MLQEQKEDTHPDAEGKHEEHPAHRADLEGLRLVEVCWDPVEARQLPVPFVLEVIQVPRRQIPRQNSIDLHLQRKWIQLREHIKDENMTSNEPVQSESYDWPRLIIRIEGKIQNFWL